MYRAGVDWAWCHPFYINFLTSTFISCSTLAKVKVVKQKGNVNFLKDYKSIPSPFPSDATGLVTNELVLKKNNEQNLTYFSKRFAVTAVDAGRYGSDDG